MKIVPYDQTITLKHREKLMEMILKDELFPLGEKKSNDYGGKDCFGNLRKAGWIGTIIRLSDKADRVMNLVTNDNQQVLDESIEDSLLDIINYAFFTLIMKRGTEQSG